MDIGKKYYLKIESDFFQRLKVKKMRKTKKGDTYTCIYLKLMLLSTKHLGLITFNNIENTLYEELALTIDEEIEDVKSTMDFLEKERVLIQTDDNEYLFENLYDQVITETESARKMRKHREKKRNQLAKNSDKSQSDHNVITMLSQCDSDKSQSDHNVITVLSQCDSDKSQSDHNVITMLSQSDKSKAKENLIVNKNKSTASLDSKVSDKIISVSDISNKDKQDG